MGSKGGAPQPTYIENPSTAYINTGLYWSNVSRVVVTFSHHTSGFITGRNSSSGSNSMLIFNNIIQWVNRPSGFTIDNGNKHIVDLQSGTCIVDGNTYTFTGGTLDSRLIYICADQLLDSRRSKCRIYAFDLFDGNGDYLFKGRPAYQNNKYGLYDSVTDTFFSSASNVEFTGDLNI